MATHLVQLLTSVAYNVTIEWKQFLQTDKRTGVKTAPLQTVSEGYFECPVLLKRPEKPDTFKVRFHVLASNNNILFIKSLTENYTYTVGKSR